jgi:hypothetical protein
MPEVKYVTQGEYAVLVIDLAHITDTREVSRVAGETIRLAQSAGGPGTLRTLIDLSGTRITGDVIAAMKSLSQHNGRYAKATAFVGLSRGWSLILSLVFRARGKRNHRVLRRRDEALAWLQHQ